MKLPDVGAQLKSRYHLDEVLGEGGFAVVYKGTDADLGRTVAVKILKPGKDGYEPTREERFLRELRAIAGLRSRHTVTLFDYGRTEEGILFMVCEFADGEDLSAYLQRTGPLTQPQTAELVGQILESLEEAHDLGLLHRDIKPANIMVKEQRGRLYVKLLDFGLAKSLTDDEAPLTAAGKVVGTPRYMAPEQLLGLELSHATDIYSLGLVAYECLMGARTAPMFNAKKQLRLPRSAAHPPLRSLVNRMLARTTEARFSTAAEVLTELDQLSLPDEPAPKRVKREKRPTRETKDENKVAPADAPREEMATIRAIPDATDRDLPTIRANEDKREMPTVRAIPEAVLDDPYDTVEDAPAGISHDGDSTTEELVTPDPDVDLGVEPEQMNSSEVRRLRKKIYGPVPKELKRERRQKERAKDDMSHKVKTFVGVFSVAALACVVALLGLKACQDDERSPNLRPLVSSAIDDSAPELNGGCLLPWEGGVVEIESATRGDRQFTAVLPDSEKGQRLPLVVFTTSSSIPSTGPTGFRDLAKTEQFVLIEAPNDYGRGAALDAVVSAKTALCIDSSRVYLVAVGGDQVEAVTEDLYEFTAVVTMTGRPLPPPEGVPHLHIHNLRDKRTPRSFSTSRCKLQDLPTVTEFTRAWAVSNVCDGEVREYNWTQCRYTSCVKPFVTCTFDGGTPWESSQCSSPAKNKELYPEVIWTFFSDLTSPLSKLRVR